MDITLYKQTDTELIEMILAGNNTCYTALFERYRVQLYSATLQKCGNEQDTEDIIQETYVKVYFNLSHYNPDYTFGQWVYTIARNLFIDFTRRKKNIGSTISIDGSGVNDINPASDSLNPEEHIISRQNGNQLDSLMHELPPHYRIIIELRFIGEYSYEEISERLGMPIGTVKTQIHRARERLCALITAQDLL